MYQEHGGAIKNYASKVFMLSIFYVQLPSIGIQPENITFKNVTLESEKYIAVRESGTLVIVDMAQPQAPARRQISADSAIMAPDRKVIALKAVTPGTPGDNLQVFNLDTKTKLKAFQMNETVEYWKWTSATRIGLVTATSVYHWEVEVSKSDAQASIRSLASPVSLACTARLLQSH
jgi:clathrin heavy chain